MKKFVIVGVVLALVLGFLGLFLPPSQPATQTVVEKIVEKLGAIPGNEVQGSEFTIGGVKTHYLVSEAGGPVASTTPCTIRSPNATTSILSWTLQFNSNVATTSAGRVYILTVATSTTRNATTSAIFQQRISDAREVNLAVYSTSTVNQNVSSSYLLPPNTFVNVGISGRDEATRPGGSCLKITAQEL